MTQEHPETRPKRVGQDDVEAVLEEIDAEAADHNAEYAAGMRHARSIVEEQLSE